MSVLQITENQVKDLLDWPAVCEAIEESFRSTNNLHPEEAPYSSQPPRSYTNAGNGAGKAKYL